MRRYLHGLAVVLTCVLAADYAAAAVCELFCPARPAGSTASDVPAPACHSTTGSTGEADTRLAATDRQHCGEHGPTVIVTVERHDQTRPSRPGVERGDLLDRSLDASQRAWRVPPYTHAPPGLRQSTGLISLRI